MTSLKKKNLPILDPGIRAGEIPPFHKLSAYTFEELCRDLFDAESSVATCEIYGDRGQTQDGIDLLAHRSNGNGIEVGQCKCYKDFPPRKISEVSDEFFEHWGRWSEENVKRFILFVACSLKTRQRQDEIIRQNKRFAEVGIIYEVWSGATVRNKLRPHPGIVATYLAPREYWVSTICGTGLSTFPSHGGYGEQAFDIVQAALVSQVEQATVRLSNATDERIELMREAWREGRRDGAVKGVQALKADSALWPFLSPEVKARLLRFEASLELDSTGNVARAKELADEAHVLAPSENEMRLRALIAYTESGPEAAFPIIDQQDDIDSLNLKAAFLLEMGQVDKGQAILNLADTSLEPNTETFRLRSLVNLQAREPNSAQLEVQKALELTPRWESVRYTAAMVSYFSALSSAALPDVVVPWPEPVEWALVKRDDQSLQRLRGAAETFWDLASRTDKAKEERHRFLAWYLACLVNDPERQEEAIKQCKSILESDPADYRAIAWGIARNFDIDLDASKVALERLVEGGTATIPHILALVGCYVTSRKYEKAAQILTDQRATFEEYQASPLWILWYIQVLVVSGDTNAALEFTESLPITDELRYTRIVTLMALARESGDWLETIQYLEKSYEETRDPRFLLDSCELMARQGNWSYIADRAEQLVEGLDTADALRLAVIGTYNERRFDTCLHLLDDYRELFRQQKLPRDLRRIRALCHQALGILPDAVAELEAIVREEPTTEDMLALAQLYLEKGDLKRLAIVARRLGKQPDLSAESALSIARIIQEEDRDLAASLWRKAIAQGLPDSLVGMALSLGFQLGLDRELGSLSVRVNVLGREGRGGIQMGAIEDLVVLVQQQHERIAKLEEEYLNGNAPIHLIAEQMNLPLVSLYRRQLADNEKAPNLIGRPLLLARHGGRPLISGFPDSVPAWHLNLDVTAILLAAHLEILDKVEISFAPLRIPPDLVPALIRMRDMVTSHQPSSLHTCRQIVDLAERGTLKIAEPDLMASQPDADGLVEVLGKEWVALFENARASGGYLVDFLPLRKRGTSKLLSELPDEVSNRAVNCRGIVESLHKYGLLSEQAYIDALEGLGGEGIVAPSQEIPELGASLYCHANIPQVLAGADLLYETCAHFQVYVERRELDRGRAELRGYEQTREINEWLSRLVERLRRGIDDELYEIIPVSVDQEDLFEGPIPENPDFNCLASLIKFKAKSGDVIWADDRHLNGYLRRDAVPIVGVNEVLKLLVSAGNLDVSTYYEKLNRLRAANVRFVPVQADEILYHLQQARVENGVVLETRQLAILRRYVATCLLQANILQQPPMPKGAANQNGEIAFLFSLSHAVAEALVELWMSGTQDEAICLARAEWLLTNLYVDYLGLRNLSAQPQLEQDAQHYLVAISLASLLSQAIAFTPSLANEEHSPRRRYFDWLFNRVLGKRFEADPQLVVTTADILKQTLLDTREQIAENDRIPVVIGLLQAFYRDLPEPIRQEIWRDTDFMANIGIRPMTVFRIDDLAFDLGDFWGSAREAINGREAAITPLGLDEAITFTLLENHQSRYAFCFTHPVTGRTGIVEGDEFGLLSNSPMEREAVLRRNRYLFDCSEETFSQVVAEIASIENPQRRMEELESWRNSSSAVYYANLRQRLSEHEQFQFSALVPPSAEGLLRHFRLASTVASGEAFQAALAASAQALIQEEGLSTAIDRLSGLPIPLPSTLVAAMADLSSKDKRALVKQLLGIPGSPISRFHLVHLLLHFSDETPAFQRLARRVVHDLFGAKGEEDFQVFFAILRWTNDEFNLWHDARVWPSHIRLAMIWAHAHRLCSILSTFVHASWLRDTFGHITQSRLPTKVFERDPAYWLDVAHPRHANRVALLLDGLCYSLGGKTAQYEEIQNLFFWEAFFEVDGIQLPAIPLLKDFTQAGNSLGTFFGGDYGEKLSLLLEPDGADKTTFLSNQLLAMHIVDLLAKAPDDVSTWLRLYAILGDLPPQEILISQLEIIFNKVDFVELFKKDVQLGQVALQTAALQVVNLGDARIRDHLKDQLINTVQLFAAVESDDVECDAINKGDFDSNEIHWSLIESALNVALAASSPQDAVPEFAHLLTQLVETWNSMIPVCKTIVQIFSEELPIDQAQNLWPLLVRLRAE